jgi:hypothetical protein
MTVPGDAGNYGGEAVVVVWGVRSSSSALRGWWGVAGPHGIFGLRMNRTALVSVWFLDGGLPSAYGLGQPDHSFYEYNK